MRPAHDGDGNRSTRGWMLAGCALVALFAIPSCGAGSPPEDRTTPPPAADPRPEPRPQPAPDPEPVTPGQVEVDPRLELRGSRAAAADDPAIWIHPSDPGRSLIFGSDKKRGLFVFDLQGREVQHVDFGTRTNNVDARRGFRWGSETIDIVAVNLRAAGKLAVLRINPDYTQGDAVSLLAGGRSSGNDISDDSYGLALYRRPRDGAMFAFDITNGKGPVRQWRLTGDGAAIRTTLVRTIDDVRFSISEGFLADDELGFVYLTEERVGIHKYNADPDAGPQTRLAFFAARDGIVRDREGLALYPCADGGGYLVLSNQGSSTFNVYTRTDNRLVKTFVAHGAHGTDGLDVTAGAVPGFPNGFVVIHDEPGLRYQVYDWTEVAGNDLRLCPR
jgi:3-phytase